MSYISLWSPMDSVGLSPVDSVGLSPMDSVGLSRTLLSQPVWRNPAESSGLVWSESGSPPEYGIFQQTPLDSSWTGHVNLALVTLKKSR